MIQKDLIKNLLYAGAMSLLIISCNGKNKKCEQISMLQDDVVTNSCLSVESHVSASDTKPTITQAAESIASGNPTIYSFGESKYYYSLTDTIDNGYKIKVLRMRSFDPEDYDGPYRFAEDDIYGNEKVFDLYYYGNRGKITLKSIANPSYIDSTYITRDLIAEKLGFNEHPDIDIKMYALGDFEYKGIRNDSIIIESCLGIIDSGCVVPFDMKFKLGNKAENFDVQEITDKWTWDDY